MSSAAESPASRARLDRRCLATLRRYTERAMKILVIDVGGTHVKALATGHKEPIKIPSGSKMTPKEMVRDIRKAVAGWKYDAVSIGYPGAVLHGKPVAEPRN